MKIAIGVRHFRVLGGAENFVLQLTKYLTQQGHAVAVYAVTGTPMEGVELNIVKQPPCCPRFCRDWMTGKLISEELLKSGADVTFGEQKIWNANVVRPGGGVEVTYWDYHLQRKWKSKWFARKIRSWCPKRHHDLLAEKKSLLGPHLSAIIVNSDLVRRDMIQCYPSTEPMIHVVHNGAGASTRCAEEKKRLRSDMMRRFGLNDSSRIALFIGHDFYRKGLDSGIISLSKAMKKQPASDWHLLVTGRGHIEAYQSIANKAGISDRIHFLGDMKDAFQAYAASDIMMLPTHYDPFAAVTVEAICYGVPVITTRGNGGCEIIRDGYNGWVVDSPDDTDLMADCLIKLSDDQILTGMQANALESAKHCRLMDSLRTVEEILTEAAHQRTATR